MEVIRLGILLAALGFVLTTTACSKTSPVSDNISAQETFCPKSLIKNEFLVRWNDGHLSVEKADSKETFVEDFVKNHESEISFYEYNTLLEVTPYSEELVKPLAFNQDTYATEMIEAASVWNEGFRGQNVIVGVVDSAVDYRHVKLQARLAQNTSEINGITGVDDDGNGLIDDKYGYDFAGNKPEPTPANHGTHVAGIIAAEDSAGNPMKSVAPSAKLVPANFMSGSGGDVAKAILAMKYVVSRGAKIINASWGGPGCSLTLKNEISSLAAQNVLFVSAAGNEGEDISSYPEFPAGFNLVPQLTIAANTLSGLQAGWSNKSFSLVHFSAPGEDILSTVPSTNGNGYGYMSGTSMAAPVVSGAAALLWSARPSATVSQIKSALINSVVSNSSPTITRGRLNVKKALEELKRLVP